MENLPLKYQGYSILMQEVPNEISLSFNISGCPHKCEDCHSPYLWEYEGHYLKDDFDSVLNNYKNYITCVCFMGGDQNEDELIYYIDKTHSYNLKFCLYTGADNVSSDILNILDYVKIGHFDINLGGLNKETTNQKFYDLKNNKEIKFYENKYKFK